MRPAQAVPLTDMDRGPALEALNAVLKTADNAVLACSALKQSYRDRLLSVTSDFALVFLAAQFDVVQARLAQRRHPYMPASLLRTQFDILEPPEKAIAVDVRADVPACVAAILSRLN